MAIKRIVCTVTNDLNFDQRMIRICHTLTQCNYDVLLVGRKKRNSLPLNPVSFRQKRLYCFFEKGKFFYIEYNIRLFLYLLFVKADVINAIDLDTILPCLFVSSLRNKHRVYDAHELFCEMDEIVKRPAIYRIWKKIESYAVPKFKNGYTIGECYAEEFRKMYGVNYQIVRNATILRPFDEVQKAEKYILYQGAVNIGRSFETLIPAMKDIELPLVICGEGNYFVQAMQLVVDLGLSDKIIFKGYIEPLQLREFTKNALIGITLFSSYGKSNYLSLANRFFDYMHDCIPQVCVAFPEYQKVNEKYEISKLIDDTEAATIAKALKSLIEDQDLYACLKSNCLKAREEYCWQQQEIILKKFYHELLG